MNLNINALGRRRRMADTARTQSVKLIDSFDTITCLDGTHGYFWAIYADCMVVLYSCIERRFERV